MPVKTFAIVLLLSMLALVPATANAANNKFGIHIISEHDLPDAAALVNSSGGQWGYVTVVIREDERDHSRWQSVFDQMRRLKLVPLVRIATTMSSSHWEAPSKEEAHEWATFLDSLNWPTTKRHVILFNEPNHKKEWGGVTDPAGYAQIYRHYYETFSERSPDFFMLPAALDLAAPNGPATMEASRYFDLMHKEDNFIFTIYNALNSHSYPNPAFSGAPTDTGKMSIEGYKWELEYLQNFGLAPDVPVFITETGWANADNFSENFKYAFERVWSDPQVVAVTPFLLNYENYPFDTFSWKNPQTNEFEEHFFAVQSMEKVKGQPEQVHSFSAIGHNIADILVSDSEYIFRVELVNTGQSIWSHEDGFRVVFDGTMQPENIIPGELQSVEPGQTVRLPVRLKTTEQRGLHTIKFMLVKDDKTIGEIAEAKFTLVSPPTLTILAKFWFMSGAVDNVSLAIYDNGELLGSYEGLVVNNGEAIIPAVRNIVPNKMYNMVLARPPFVPSARNDSILAGGGSVDFGRLLPLDLNNDGKLDHNDLLVHMANPSHLMRQLLPI